MKSLSAKMYQAGQHISPKVMSLSKDASFLFSDISKDIQGRAINPPSSVISIITMIYKAGQ